VFLPDANHHILKIQGLLALGIINFLDSDRHLHVNAPDLITLNRTSCLCSQHIKRAIGIDIPTANSSDTNPILILNRLLQLLGLKVNSIATSNKHHSKTPKIYQLDRLLLHDGREEIFKIWQSQHSRELMKSA
jgi:hypothetical protein